MQAAFPCGVKQEEGHGILWSTKNGMILNARVEAVFDDGRLVIIPCNAGEGGDFKAVILDDSLLDNVLNLSPLVRFRDIHQQPLVFRTTFRPGKRCLYLHCLFTLLRRRRYACKGWESDTEKTLTGLVWASPGEYLRRSVIRALAVEAGDVVAEEMPEAKNGLSDELDYEGNKTCGEAIALRLKGGLGCAY